MIKQHYISQILHNESDINGTVKLYVLVDGIQYERVFGEPLKNAKGICSLFTFPEDKKLDFAGPWLLNVPTLTPEMLHRIDELESKYPAVSWIITSKEFETLAHHLGLYLTVSFPSKKTGLLRFYDCRVLNILPIILLPKQMKTLMTEIYKWAFLFEENIKVHCYENDAVKTKIILKKQ